MQVLIFGGRTYFRGGGGGYDKAEWKILQGRRPFNLVLSVENTLFCMFQRLFIYFQDTGVLIWGVCAFGALQPTANFSKKWRGTYFRRGTYLRGLMYHGENDADLCWHPLCIPPGSAFSTLELPVQKHLNVHIEFNPGLIGKGVLTRRHDANCLLTSDNPRVVLNGSIRSVSSFPW